MCSARGVALRSEQRQLDDGCGRYECDDNGVTESWAGKGVDTVKVR